MKECLVAVADGTYTFGFDELIQSAGLRWADTRFIPARGDWANSTYGHLQLHNPNTGHADVIAGLLAGARGIGLEGEPGRVAESMAWLASREGFPDDGSVIVLGWRRDQVALNPGTTAEALLELPRP